jgi:hypothetical protein
VPVGAHLDASTHAITAAGNTRVTQAYSGRVSRLRVMHDDWSWPRLTLGLVYTCGERTGLLKG